MTLHNAPPPTFHPLATMVAIEAAGFALIGLLIVLVWLHSARSGRPGEDA